MNATPVRVILAFLLPPVLTAIVISAIEVCFYWIVAPTYEQRSILPNFLLYALIVGIFAYPALVIAGIPLFLASSRSPRINTAFFFTFIGASVGLLEGSIVFVGNSGGLRNLSAWAYTANDMWRSIEDFVLGGVLTGAFFQLMLNIRKSPEHAKTH